ncbi:MAG: amidohydrolase family protein [Phycisphaeraceae bacterium]|nr:amidohydrolase family protein [Phycisphaeraceae bacterium]
MTSMQRLRFLRRAAVFALAGFTSAAGAQDFTHKAPAQSRPIAIVGGTVHPVSGPSIPNGHVVFDNGRITAVGPGVPRLGQDVERIDATGLHIYPGLFGAITDMGLNEVASTRATIDVREVGDFTPEVRAAVAVNPDSAHFPVARSNGILTVGVVPTGGRVAGRAAVMRVDGWTWEDKTVLENAGLVVVFPRVRPVTDWWMNRSEEDQLRDIAADRRTIDTYFDQAQDYVRQRAADPARPVDQRFEAMRPFLPDASGKPAQRPILLYASDVDQIAQGIAWALDRGLRPILVGGRDAPMVAELLKTNDIPVIVTGTFGFPRRADSPHDDAFTLPLRLEAAGIRWCLASGDETANERNLPYQAAKAVAYGLSVDRAIRAITLSPAEILGVGDRLGSLEQGKSATLIVTTGNPLEITSDVRMAFVDGRRIDLSNRQIKLFEKYLEKYRQLGLIGR